MEGLISVGDKSSITRISPQEDRLRRLNSVTETSFQNELDSIIEKDSSAKPLNKKLWDTCIEAESLFVGKMLKEMKKTVPKNEWLHGGQAEDIFEDMLYDEYSLQVSKNSNLGMAKLLYNELSRRM